MANVKIFTEIGELLTLKGAVKKSGRQVVEKDLGIVKNGAIVCVDGRVHWVGKQTQLKKSLWKGFSKNPKEQSLNGHTVMPAFVECHTHLIYAGNRSAEFELRNQGVSYQEIARRGGGILSTMNATRRASEAQLLELAQGRVDRFVRQGVATVEVKSGYALDLVNELKMLRVGRKLKRARVLNTFLGPHAVPKKFKSAQAYLDFVIEKVLPKVCAEGLADRADIFIEKEYFSRAQAEQFFAAASGYGLKLTAHAEQLSRQGGAELASTMGASSVDHLVEISGSDIKGLAVSDTTCVLLPAADMYLQMAYPPARKLIDAGARVALATDFNPGSSPTQDLSLVGLLARLEMKMTLPEVLVAYTVGAAHALDLGRELGGLASGYHCDFVEIGGTWRDLFYQVGFHPVAGTWKSGQRLRPKH